MPQGFEVSPRPRARPRTWLGIMPNVSKEDRRRLITAFHKAESLAEFALEDAIEQVRETYREDLVRQRAEEEKHVRVFASYLGETNEVPRPKGRKRPESVWFTLLLLNELTGYCQFAFLFPLLRNEEQELLAEVMGEEEEHVERLLRWMEPVWGERGGPQSVKMVERFREDLPGRMEQFFEGEELDSLRKEWRIVGSLLNQLLSSFR